MTGGAIRHRGVVPCVMLGTLFGPLNSTMITVALPEIGHDLSLSHTATGWLVTVYLIAMACLHPVAGKLGDRWGQRQLMLGAMVLIMVASVGAALSASLALLVVCRLLQAAAGAVLATNGIAVLRRVVPAGRLGSVLGLAGAAAPFAAATGPAVATVLVGAFGWRSLFLANLPLAAVSLLLGVWTLPRDRARPPGARPPFDVFGAVTACVMLVALAVVLNVPSSRTALAGWATTLAVSLTALLIRELRIRDPVLQPRLFARPRFLMASVGVCLSNFAMYGVLLTVPPLFLLHHDWPGVFNGVALTVMTALSAALAPVGGRLTDRHGPAWASTSGMLLVTAGLVTVAVTVDHMSIAVLMCALAAIGAGLGVSTPAYRTESVRAVRSEDTGMASGLYLTCRYLGSIVCSSLLGGPLAPHDETRVALSYVVFAATALGCVVLPLLLPRFLPAARTPHVHERAGESPREPSM